MTTPSPQTSFLPKPNGWQIALMATIGGVTFGSVSFLTSSGCTILTNDALPDDAGVFEGGEGGDANSAGTCTACSANACVATWALCLTNADCAAIRACATGVSGDPTACACSAAQPDAGVLVAETAYRAFATCNDSRTCTTCATDCSSSCADHIKPTAPAACDSNVPDASTPADAAGDDDAGDASAPPVEDAGAPSAATADTCANCTDSKCGDPKRACAIGSECAAYLACAVACTDRACVSACAQSHASGNVAASELASCTQTSCVNECGLKLGAPAP